MKNSYDTDHTSPQRAKICQLQYYKNISNGKQGLRLLNPSYQSPEQVWEQDVPAGMRKLSWCRYGPAGILTHNALVMTNELLKQHRFVSNNTFSGKKASWQSHTRSERCDNASVLLLGTHVYIRACSMLLHLTTATQHRVGQRGLHCSETIPLSWSPISFCYCSLIKTTHKRNEKTLR